MTEPSFGIDRIESVDAVADTPEARPVLHSETVYRGSVWNVRRDRVDLGDSGVVSRDVVDHPGAVAVVARNDGGDILVVQQYRHPAQALLWELPAGLRDPDDDSVISTGQRELAEETGFAADHWSVLLTMFTTPGGSAERLTIVQASGLERLDPQILAARTGEERDMPIAFVSPALVREAILSGLVSSPTMVAGVLAIT